MPSGPSRQRDQPGRREDAGLAHPATDQLARPSRAPDERRACPTTTEPTGQAEALRQAERDRVGRSRQARPARRPQGDDRVPEPGAVDVERDAVVVGDVATSLVVVGVSGWAIEWAWVFSSVTRPVIGSCGVVRVAEGGVDRVEVHRAVRPVLRARTLDADDRPRGRPPRR